MNYNTDTHANLDKTQYIKNRMAIRNANQMHNIEQAEYDKHINNVNWREEPTRVTMSMAQNLPLGVGNLQVENNDDNSGEDFIKG